VHVSVKALFTAVPLSQLSKLIWSIATLWLTFSPVSGLHLRTCILWFPLSLLAQLLVMNFVDGNSHYTRISKPVKCLTVDNF